MQDLMKEGGKKDRVELNSFLILFCDCTPVSSASSAEGVSFHPYQLSPLVSGAYTPLKLRHRSACCPAVPIGPAQA